MHNVDPPGAIVANDINNYIGKRLSDEKFDALKYNCVLPSSFKYPSKIEYGKHRSFNQQWLNEYVWLSYSPFQDGVYCKYCALFSDSTKIDKLVKSPLHFWTTATQKFKKHSESESHQRASILANNFMKIMTSQQHSIDQQLNVAVASQISLNKLKLHSIIQTVLFCGRQNIPLRGHREGSSTINPGNFKALVKFRVDSGDKLLQDHLETGPRNATYTSKNIQN